MGDTWGGFLGDGFRHLREQCHGDDTEEVELFPGQVDVVLADIAQGAEYIEVDSELVDPHTGASYGRTH